MIGRYASRRREPASRIQVRARHRQRIHLTVHPRTQRAPTAPIPFGYAVGCYVSSRREPAARIQVRARHRQRLHLTVHPRTQRAPTAPIPFGYVVGCYVSSRREPASRIQVRARHRQRIHVAVHPRAQRAPTAPIPFGYVVGRCVSSRREPAARIQVRARHRQRLHEVVHPRTQRAPTVLIPFGNPVGRHASRRREPASRIQVRARHRQCRHIAVHPRTQRAPTAPVPFGNPVGHHAARHREITANVETARTIHHGGKNGVVCSGNAWVDDDPISVAERWVYPDRIRRRRVIHHNGQTQCGVQSAEYGVGCRPGHFHAGGQFPTRGIRHPQPAVGNLASRFRQHQLRARRRTFHPRPARRQFQPQLIGPRTPPLAPRRGERVTVRSGEGFFQHHKILAHTVHADGVFLHQARALIPHRLIRHRHRSRPRQWPGHRVARRSAPLSPALSPRRGERVTVRSGEGFFQHHKVLAYAVHAHRVFLHQTRPLIPHRLIRHRNLSRPRQWPGRSAARRSGLLTPALAPRRGERVSVRSGEGF